MTQPLIDPCARGVIDAQPCPRMQRREQPALRRRIILAACVVSSSMAYIDGSVLTVSLPALRTAFATDLATVQWVINGYVLALAALTLIGGALADTYGKSRILLIGCFFFGAASAACALSGSIGWLIGLRLLQGAAAALVTPASLALIGVTYAEDERIGAIGIWAAATSLTTAAGPVLGGWLTEQFGWPAVFLINPPLAIIAVALLVKSAPTDQLEIRRFDIVGAAIIAVALGVLAWALSELGHSEIHANGSFAFDARITTLLVLGIAGIGGYAIWERVTDHPMTPPELARNHDFVGLNLATLLIYSGLSIAFFLLPFELVDHPAGLVFLPFSLGVGLLSPYFARFADKIGARAMLVVGSIGAGIAYLWMAIAHDRSLAIGIIVPQIFLGISFAVLVVPLTASVISSVASSDEGLASAINNAASRVAQLVGVAVAAGLGALMFGYQLGLAVAAAASAAGALAMATVRK